MTVHEDSDGSHSHVRLLLPSLSRYELDWYWWPSNGVVSAYTNSRAGFDDVGPMGGLIPRCDTTHRAVDGPTNTYIRPESIRRDRLAREGRHVKIVFATPGYPPSTGGVETHVHEIATRLGARDHDVTVVTGDARRVDTPRRERREGVRVVRCRGIAPNDAFHLAPGVAQAVRRVDADIVHAHNYHALLLPFAALGACRTPLIITPHYHGGSVSLLRDRLLSCYAPVGAAILRHSDAVIAVSDWEHGQIRADFGLDADVIPNGIDIDRFAGATPHEHGHPYLLTVGRLEGYKGVQHAIRALGELPGYDLLVAGSGPYRDALEHTARDAGVTERVSFLGYVDDDDLPGLYAGAAAYLALSSFEAYGLTVAEAIAAGTPCVVREAGALADWMRYEGIVGVSVIDPGTVGTAIAGVVGTDPSRDALRTWNEVVDRTLAAYRRVTD
jgi:glycosyltransferase involved in cell wall biosynthesis